MRGRYWLLGLVLILLLSQSCGRTHRDANQCQPETMRQPAHQFPLRHHDRVASLQKNILIGCLPSNYVLIIEGVLFLLSILYPKHVDLLEVSVLTEAATM